jgi:oxygen-independent coproporphyrinogen-3 oxidase
MIEDNLVERGREWVEAHGVDAAEQWLASRTLEMHCPYIYPPTSRYEQLSQSELYTPSVDWDDYPPALYVHIPYCIYRCSFCNFALDVLREANAPVDQYLDTLELEIKQILERTARSRVRLSSIHIGGGTPSALSPVQLEKLLTILNRYFQLEDGREFCIEVNPDTIRSKDRKKLDLMKDAGVTRVSLGVQSMDDDVLRSLARLHSTEMVEQAIEATRATGIKSINIDMMYALPRLTHERWTRSLERAVALKPDAVTMYELRISPDSPLNAVESTRSGNRNLQRAMGMLYLRESGYFRSSPNQYITGWEHAQKHYIDVRERLADIIGLGVSAIASIGSCTFQAPGSLAEYMAQMKGDGLKYNGVRMTTQERCSRGAILGLKSPHGVSLSTYQTRLGVPISLAFPTSIEALTAQGYIEQDGDHLRTTDLGSFFMDQIAVLFFQPQDIMAVRTREVEHLGVYWHQH